MTKTTFKFPDDERSKMLIALIKNSGDKKNNRALKTLLLKCNNSN